MELVCPAGNLTSLRAAVDHGADAVYLGLRDDTNARHFTGLNFDSSNIIKGIGYAHSRGRKVYMAINTYAQASGWKRWTDAVDAAASLGVDALIIADIGVFDYAATHYPQMRLHLSVQGSATNPGALRFFHEQFGIQRAVIPRVLSLKQVQSLIDNSPVAIEVFGFGSLCVMVEGRCLLSSFATGESPNTYGACSPAKAVQWKQTPRGLETRLNHILIDRFTADEHAGYPTLCKGRFQVRDATYYAIEEPTSLNTLELLPELYRSGIAAIKIEGRQRSPVYVAQVTEVWRSAIDACMRAPDSFKPLASWQQILARVSEGEQTTLGALHRPWQ